ncbi:MAG: hypothetical protein UT09_C0009G0008 [Parcubacteria group bacterium GW2011_GWF2_38_8]|nr:MAG: hypothetical protein UT09_C0009G0008 [Parcubacteria group bacterium GW2011_GWF2_38_8]
MDKKSKILLTILVILTIASVGYTFYKTMIKQDFEVVNIEPITDEDTSEDIFEDTSETEAE